MPTIKDLDLDIPYYFSEQEFMIMIYKSDKNGRDQKEIHESASQPSRCNHWFHNNFGLKDQIVMVVSYSTFKWHWKKQSY